MPAWPNPRARASRRGVGGRQLARYPPDGVAVGQSATADSALVKSPAVKRPRRSMKALRTNLTGWGRSHVSRGIRRKGVDEAKRVGCALGSARDHEHLEG